MSGQSEGGDGAEDRGYRDTAQVDVPMPPPHATGPLTVRAFTGPVGRGGAIGMST